MVNVKENPLIKKSFTSKSPMIQYNTTEGNLQLKENQGSLVVHPKSSRFPTLEACFKADDSLLSTSSKAPLIIKVNGVFNNNKKCLEVDHKGPFVGNQVISATDYKSILKLEPVVVLERLSSLETSYRKPPDKKRKKRENKDSFSENEISTSKTSSNEDLSSLSSHEGFHRERKLSENDEGNVPPKAAKKKRIRPPYTKPLPRGRKKKTIPSEVEESDPSKRLLQGEVKGSIKKKKEKPVELFRKDLISAMKIPDHEALETENYWIMTDPWKKEWEHPVQVPVSPSSIPQATLREIRRRENWQFRLPKRYLKLEKNKNFDPEKDIIAAASELANSVCPYDLDTLDLQWLDLVNQHRHDMGLVPLSGESMEQLIYDFESQAEEYFKRAMKNEEVMRLAYDENVACDICRKIYTEDGNEIVFCESCNISVHQFCYGVVRIPQGSWLCHTCALGIRPSCVLCPNLGGAMKNIKDQHRWVHVSCAIWIPEVEISRLNRIGSIIQIDQIPESRFTLACSICHIREGACIQCSVKSCKVAYHVTCGYNENLEMSYSLEDEDENTESFFESFCKKHCKNKKEKTDKDTALQEREKKVAELKTNFFKHVNLSDTKETVKMGYEDNDFLINLVFNYWLLKRRSNFNNPLYYFESEEVKLNQVKEDNINVRKNTYKSLRSSLEKARNLAYMICTREKRKKALYKAKREIFEKQYEMLRSTHFNKADTEIIINANHGDSIYDKMTYMYQDPPFAENLMIDYLYGHLKTMKREKSQAITNRKEISSTTTKVKRKYRRRLKESGVTIDSAPDKSSKPRERRFSASSSNQLMPSFHSPSNLSTSSRSSFPYCSSIYSSEDTSISVASTSSLDSKAREPTSFAQAHIPKMESEPFVFEKEMKKEPLRPKKVKKEISSSLIMKEDSLGLNDNTLTSSAKKEPLRCKKVKKGSVSSSKRKRKELLPLIKEELTDPLDIKDEPLSPMMEIDMKMNKEHSFLPLIKEELTSPLAKKDKPLIPLELNDDALASLIKKEPPSPSSLSPSQTGELAATSLFIKKESPGHSKQTTIKQFFKPLNNST